MSNKVLVSEEESIGARRALEGALSSGGDDPPGRPLQKWWLDRVPANPLELLIPVSWVPRFAHPQLFVQVAEL